MERDCCDVAVVGGGINGCGIARDAAGRGLSVLLVEQNDLASGTSSSSTKLIHGGLRYLEHGAFRLVRESLLERETLMRVAPHLVRPMRFVLPHTGTRPEWFLRLGLFVYDAMAGGALPRCETIDLKNEPAAKALVETGYARAFEYSDCWADDMRLVLENAKDAARLGADIVTRTRCEKAHAENGEWILDLRAAGGEVKQTRARCLINAAGPWADIFLRAAGCEQSAPKLRLVQGSHLVVPRLFDGGKALVLPNADGRIVFAIPFEEKHTLIGTTDRDIKGKPEDARVDDGEKEYLLNAARRFFGSAAGESEIVWSFCGVRPLFDDGKTSAQKASRDYVLRLQTESGAPLLNVFGGKLTTYRQLAQQAVSRLPLQGATQNKNWTAQKPLPGGELPEGGVKEVARRLCEANAQMQQTHADRLARTYGACAQLIFKPGEDWGKHFGADLYAREVDYLMREEWAQTAEDILRRRTFLGLSFSPAAAAGLDDYMNARRSTLQ